MALLNYMAPGLYAGISNLRWDKHRKYVGWDVYIYSDAEKKVVLATKSFELWPNYIPCDVVDTTFRSEPVTHPLVIKIDGPSAKDQLINRIGEAYLVGANPTGIWADRAYTRAVWEGENWAFWYFTDGQIIYSENEDKYYQVNRPSPHTREFTLQETICYSDARIWDRWFAPEKVHAADTNLSKQIYSFMKHQPGFETCTDI